MKYMKWGAECCRDYTVYNTFRVSVNHLSAPLWV